MMNKQRNQAIVAAILFCIVGIVGAVPTALDRRQRLKAANDQLQYIEALIEISNNQIRKVEAEIVDSQKQIVNLIGEQKQKQR